MIVNLARLRQERTTPPPPEFDPANPGRRNPLSMEQQKKRAKDLLREMRSGDLNALARLQRHSPEFPSKGRSPQLHDAQHVIACENGFRKWTDLKAHIDRIDVEQQVTIKGRPSALDGTGRALHIRCGQDIMHDLALAGFNGDFLSFPDPYAEGPVPETQSLEEFVRIRAGYLEPGDRAAFEGLSDCYQALERVRDYPIAHIWMEHDAHDQLILARLLYYFSEVSVRPARLRMVNVTHFPGFERFVGLGQLPPQALRMIWDDFEDVTETHLLFGKKVWSAVTAPSPEALLNIVQADAPVLPTMGQALARHIRQLPSATNGMSLTEQLTLRILAEKGTITAARLWGWYNGQYEPQPFLGDTGYWRILAGLSSAANPALAIDGQRAATEDVKWASRVELLPLGESLLRNQADWLESKPPERWVGGVRIDSQQNANWRFDHERESVFLG
jgi:hypothetical protein